MFFCLCITCCCRVHVPVFNKTHPLCNTYTIVNSFRCIIVWSPWNWKNIDGQSLCCTNKGNRSSWCWQLVKLMILTRLTCSELFHSFLFWQYVVIILCTVNLSQVGRSSTCPGNDDSCLLFVMFACFSQLLSLI